MEIGIFAKTFARHSLEAILDAVQQCGLHQIQFNMSCTGLPSMPERIEPDIVRRIAKETAARNMNIAAVSGTFNMIHPNISERQLGLYRLRTLAASCKEMNTNIITLCTGTRHPTNMWHKHVENNDPSAWSDLLHSIETAIGIAEQYQVTLAIEPEISNVIDSAEKGRKLLNEMKSSQLKVVMDAANLFHPGETNNMQEIMDKAFYLLGDDIVIAHAKDLAGEHETEFVAAGQGMLDYDHYLQLLHTYNYKGALILHGLGEHQVEASLHFLKQKIVNLESMEANI